jgi:hypothetical protein
MNVCRQVTYPCHDKPSSSLSPKSTIKNRVGSRSGSSSSASAIVGEPPELLLDLDDLVEEVSVERMLADDFIRGIKPDLR